jgi:HEAT repeat protein
MSGLIKALKNEVHDVRRSAAKALGQIGTEITIPDLIKALEDKYFVEANRGSTLDYAIEALDAIQEHCKYYNYTLTQPIL